MDRYSLILGKPRSKVKEKSKKDLKEKGNPRIVIENSSNRTIIRHIYAEDVLKKELKDLEKKIRTPMSIHRDDYIVTNYGINYTEIPIERGRVNIIWATGMSSTETESLRKKVERAINDPNYIVITNYPINYIAIPNNPS